MKDLIANYVTYNYWANKQLAALLLTIDDALLDKEVKSSFTSLRKTVHHIWDAEMTWMARLKNETIQWPPSAKFKNPTIDEFLKTSKYFIDFIASKDETFFTTYTTYKNNKGDNFTTINSGIIMHCMNHSTFHRGQLITILRSLEITNLPATDLIAYLRIR